MPAVPAVASGSTKSFPKVPANDRSIPFNGDVRIPIGIVDHESYRRWARSLEYPTLGRFAYLNGIIWVDLSMEQLFTHNLVKTQFTVALGNWVASSRGGYLFSDRALYSHPEPALTTEPDLTFVAYSTVEAKRLRLIEGAVSGYVELEGSADMVLEIVSQRSERKDNVDLRELYWRAGVREYWLVDVRGKPLRFELLHRGKNGYVATRRQPGGWLKSSVFNASIRLTSHDDPLGHPEFRVEMRG